ncbi:hypothetical protein B0H11DRAFT_1898764 [Mycena galericulata]|nr:hypothetical protein B0H11DRAFT_1898764 [Mycena galericulata]
MSVYVNGILAPSWSCSGLAHFSVFAASLCVPPVASWAFLVSVDAGQYRVHSMTLISRTSSLIDTIPSPSGPGCVPGASQFSSIGSFVNARIPTFVETNGASRLHFTPTVINHPAHVPFEAIRFKSDAPNTSKSLSSSYPSPLNVSSFGSNISSSSSRVPSELVKITPLQPRSRKVGSGSTPSRDQMIATHASQNAATSIFDQMENVPKGTLLALARSHGITIPSKSVTKETRKFKLVEQSEGCDCDDPNKLLQIQDGGGRVGIKRSHDGSLEWDVGDTGLFTLTIERRDHFGAMGLEREYSALAVCHSKLRVFDIPVKGPGYLCDEGGINGSGSAAKRATSVISRHCC